MRAGSYSGGMKRRLSVAIALLGDPQVSASLKCTPLLCCAAAGAAPQPGSSPLALLPLLLPPLLACTGSPPRRADHGARSHFQVRCFAAVMQAGGLRLWCGAHSACSPRAVTVCGPRLGFIALAGVHARKPCIVETMCHTNHRRRHLWDLVDRVKRGRAVVLTTHSMEEADILGDRWAGQDVLSSVACWRRCTTRSASPPPPALQLPPATALHCIQTGLLTAAPTHLPIFFPRRIGIMARGRLRCLGTSLRLKARFGSGYRVSIRVQGGGSGLTGGDIPLDEGSSAGGRSAFSSSGLAGAGLRQEDSEIQPAPLAVQPGLHPAAPPQRGGSNHSGVLVNRLSAQGLLLSLAAGSLGAIALDRAG